MRPWLFTNTFYGNWPPGDPRGCVTSVRDLRRGEPFPGRRIEHDQYGTSYEPALPGLYHAAAAQLKGPPILLTRDHAEVLLSQLIETSEHRGWPISAVAIMPDHGHWIAAIPYELKAAKALADFKAYGSRALNRRFGPPVSDRWWTEKGSKRLLPDENALAAAMRYVLERQPNPLLTWASGR
jgi:REP element-mobilizing transposase RayT